MRKVIAVSVLILALAVALYADPRPLQFLSTQTFTPNASTAISAPSDSDFAVMSVRTAGVHINWRGATATTSDTYYAPGAYTFDNQRAILNGATVITSSDGTAVVAVDYFKRK